MKALAALAVGIVALTAALTASAQQWHRIGTNLIGYQEVPALSTNGSGEFDAMISADDSTVTWELTYRGLHAVQQAHIHFGQRGVNGGISVFLCTNLNAAMGDNCPLSAGTITGSFTAANVVGPTGQGIGAGELAELIRAIRAGVAYVNVHTEAFPTGELRGQLDAGHSH